MILFSLTIVVVNWRTDISYDSTIYILRYVSSLAYIVVSFAFIFTGLRFYSKFKLADKNRARNHKCQTFWSVFIISSIFMFRGVFNFIRAITKFDITYEDDAWANNTIGFPIYNFCYIFLLDIFPIIFLMLSVHLVVQKNIQKLMTREDSNFYSCDEVRSSRIRSSFNYLLPEDSSSASEQL